MRRRDFIGTAVAAVVSGAAPATAADATRKAEPQACAFETLPNRIAGMIHQPRCLMLNLLSLERMINNAGKLTPFPGHFSD